MSDRLLCGIWSLFLSPGRIEKVAIALRLDASFHGPWRVANTAGCSSTPCPKKPGPEGSAKHHTTDSLWWTLSLRVDRAPELLGARGHGPVHASPCCVGALRAVTGADVCRMFNAASYGQAVLDISASITIRCSKHIVDGEPADPGTMKSNRAARTAAIPSWSA
jgi:hypothetical protein